MALKLTIAVCAAVLCGCSAVTPKSNETEMLFKNYALSSCISYGFDEASAKEAASAAARGYFELGDLPVEAHSEAAMLSKEFLKQEYKSKHNANLSLMKCIDFYQSQELHNIYLQHASKK